MNKTIFILIALFLSIILHSQTPSSLDPSFNSVFNSPTVRLTGVEGVVKDLLRQPDGKILVVGEFGRYNGFVANDITRLNSDGSKDVTFNPGNLNIGRWMTGVRTVGLKSNGKIVIGGDFTFFNDQVTYVNRIVGFNSDGTQDTTFSSGTGINSGFNGSVRKVLILPDDKILVFGDFTSYNGNPVNRIARLHSNGTFDATFSSGNGADKIIKDAVLLPDGKILISGNFTTYSGSTSKNIARLNSDGTIDASFSAGLGFHLQTYAFESSVSDISLQDDGKIIAVGYFTMFNNLPQKNLARLNPDGTIDTTFNIGNSIVADLNSSDDFKTWIAPDGKIYLSTLSSYNNTPTKGLFRLHNDGSIDTSFNIRRGFREYPVRSMLFMADSNILIGGDFIEFDGVDDYLIKISNAGVMDHTFKAGKGFNRRVTTVLIQPDGKTLVGGNFDNYNNTVVHKLVRLSETGGVDESFVTGSGFDYFVRCLALQPDGKILAAGDFTSYNGFPVSGKIVRINSDGSLDTTFNMDASNFPGAILGITVQPDGKILLGGSGDYITDFTAKIKRLNPDGSIDTSFNIVTGTGSTGFYNCVRKIVLQSDGKILAIGDFSTINGTTSNSIIRFNTDGTIDASFNVGNGPKTGSNSSYLKDILLQSDGKIIVSGEFNSFNDSSKERVARLNTDGTLDNTFNIAPNDFNLFDRQPVVSMALQPDSKLIIVGNFFTNHIGNTCIMRVTNTGLYDSTLQGDASTNSTDIVALKPNGKIIIAGQFTQYESSIVNRLVQLNSDGSMDLDSNSAGFNNIVNTIAVQSDSKILVGGEFTAYNSVEANKIIRLQNNGTIDTSFNYGLGFNDSVKTIVLQPDNKILIGGNFTSYDGVTANRIIRLNSNGSIDNSFVTGTGFNNEVQSIVVQSDGKILVCGSFSYYNGVVIFDIIRLNGDGSVDASFITGSGFNNTASSLAVQPDGRILVCGNFTMFNGMTSNRIVRLNSDGTLDSSFITGAGANNKMSTMILLSNGKILIGGDFTSFNGVTLNRLVRLNADGTRDFSFNIGSGFDRAVNKILLQQDGKIIVGGNLDNFNGYAAKKIVRLNPDGTKDTAFDTATGFNSFVYGMALQNDGKILAGGVFTSYKSSNQNYIARLMGDNSILSIDTIDSNEKKQLRIYPNPVNDFIYFASSDSLVNSYEIYDIMGKKIESRKTTDENSINVSFLNEGLYIIQFKTDSGIISAKFFKK